MTSGYSMNDSSTALKLWSESTSSSASSSSQTGSSASLKTMHERELRRMAVTTVYQPYSCFSTGDSAYNPRYGLLYHPQLFFWDRGPGWRSSHMGTVESGEEYFVFEPNYLQISDGILHTFDLRDSLSDTSTVDQESLNFQSVVGRGEKQLQEWYRVRDEGELWETDEERARGSGDATEVPNSRAVYLVTPMNRNACYGFTAGSTPLPSLPPLSSWTNAQVIHFLFAWQSLQRVTSRLSRDCARIFLDLRGRKGNHSYYPQVSVPLPFILPWPTDADTQDDSPFSLPFTTTLRGCRWPELSPSDTCDSGSKFSRSLTAIGCRVAHLLHVKDELTIVVRTLTDTWYEGKRPIRQTEELNRRRERSFELYFWGTSEVTFEAVSALLPSSFMFSIGTEQLMPWPAFIIAPLAPGWVGGFMGGGRYFGLEGRTILTLFPFHVQRSFQSIPYSSEDPAFQQ